LWVVQESVIRDQMIRWTDSERTAPGCDSNPISYLPIGVQETPLRTHHAR